MISLWMPSLPEEWSFCWRKPRLGSSLSIVTGFLEAVEESPFSDHISDRLLPYVPCDM